jgi:hypothetical protein
METETSDEHMVVVVDGRHVLLSLGPDWLRLGLSRVGTTLSEIYPTTSWVAGGGARYFRVV